MPRTIRTAPAAQDAGPRDRINAAHRAAVSHRDQAVEHAIECGRLLNQVKENLGHGGFRKWIAINCDFEQSTATRYMAAAEQNATGVAISSLRSLFPSGRAERKPPAIGDEKAERSQQQPTTTPPAASSAAIPGGDEPRNLSPDGEQPHDVAADNAPYQAEPPCREDGAPDAQEIAEAEAALRADQEAMAKLLEADDKLAWAMGEVKRLGALVSFAEQSAAEALNGKGAYVKLLKEEQRKTERLGEKLDIANALIARKDQELEALREENGRLRERISIMEEAA